MSTFDAAAFQLSVYSGEFRWQGELALPAHRRLSDFVNDADQQFLELAKVKFAVWETNAYRTLERAETAVVFKQNIVLVAVNDETLSAPGSNGADRVSVAPQRIFLQVPPFIVEGNLHTPVVVEWSRAINATRAAFVPLTDACFWHFREQALLGTNIKLMLVHRTMINSIQNTRAPESALARESRLLARLEQ